MTAPERVTASDSTAAVTPPRDATEQLSRSGTPRFGDGTTRPDDYVAELANPRLRMELFEEMRASDGAVHTALHTREQLIHSANWMLATADQSDRGKQILEFCEDNVYPLLEDILRQLAGAVQYGVGLFEPVYAWSDEPFVKQIARGKLRRASKAIGRQIYLHKIARIRQKTIWTFNIAETGDLLHLRQYVYMGSGLGQRDIPAEKLVSWTYNQQGDDYWGVPPTRHVYKAWKFKQQLEKLGLLGFDRFGVGTPVAEGGQDWTDKDFQDLLKFLRGWRSGANSGLVHPYGGKIDIKGGEGTVYGALLEWVKWYTLETAKVYLTQGTELGSTDTGARALGEVMYDQAEGVIQADCEQVAAVINERVIVNLVRWNFGPQPSYPYFAPSQRVRSSSAIGTLIATLIEKGAVKWSAEDEQWLRDAMGMPEIDIAAREEKPEDATPFNAQDIYPLASARQQELVSWTAEDENWMRGKMGLPPIDVTKRQAEIDAKAAAAAALAELAAQAKAQQQGVGGGDGAPRPDDPASDEGRGSGRGLGRGGRGVARRAPRALSADAAPLPYRTRESHAWEMAVVRPEIVGRDLDIETARTAGEVRDVLRAIDLALALMVMRAAAKGVASLADSIAEIAVAAALEEQLRSALTDAAERARDYGARTVRSEVARQAQPEGVGPGAFPGSTPAPVEMPTDAPSPEAIAEQRDHVLAAEIDRAVAEEIGRRTAAARGAARDAIAQAGAREPEELASVAKANAETALEELSPARTQQNVGGVVNVAFGAGRGDGADDIRDGGGEFKSKVYSAVMDGGTCEECEKWDGAEFPIDFPEDVTGVQCPNPKCAGTLSKCRCIWIYIAASESAPTLPASKGPIA